MSKQNKNIESIYLLSPMQQGMLFHSIYNPNSKNYFEQISVTISGKLDAYNFKKAWEFLFSKYSVFRTSFVYKKLDKMLQVVHYDVELPFHFEDWSQKNESEQIDDLSRFLELDKERGFNLNKAPLMRITLLKLSRDKFKLIWSHHHILFDGWSLSIIMKDLLEFYESLQNNLSPNSNYSRPYSDYIKYLQNIDHVEDQKFWKNYLKDFKEKTPIVVDTIPFLKESSNYKKLSISIDKHISEKILTFAKSNKITLNIILQACWAILLHKYTNSDDIIFGATFSGRPASLEYSENMVGLFINTLPIRAKIKSNIPIVDWIKEFNLSLLELRDHEHTALFEIQKISELPSKQNLFDSLFVFENYPVDKSLNNSFSELKFSEFSTFEQTNYPLTIVSGPGSNINIDAAFDESLISETSINLMLGHFRNILLNVVLNGNSKIDNINYLDQLEKEFLLPIKFMDSDIDEPNVLIKHFEKIAKQNPNNIALRFNDVELTYNELNERANNLASLLLTKNIRRENLVGIYLNRRIEMIVSILAVMKTGAGYVPIDSSYPKERVNFIISDAKLNLLISEKELNKDISFVKENIISIENISQSTENLSRKNPDIEIFAENIIYIIYTSGSTGKPKGTILQNKSVYNFIRDFSESLYLTSGSRVLQFASIGFDASIPEIFAPLLNGGSVQMISKEQINDLNTFGQFVISNKITNLLLPPSVLSILDFIDSPYLVSVLSAGEACTWNIVEKWSRKYRFINGYGPTESSVGCTWGQYSQKLNFKNVPIGIPTRNVKVYVLDKNLLPVPIGVIGELFVGENALARGYLNLPELTASRFIPNPYSKLEGERLYQTKDLVKVLPDGQLEFIGRSDTQIKLRGFRIETGEIETIIDQFDLVEQNAVVLNESDDKKLVAFIVSSQKDKIVLSDLKNYLSEKLPSFMIPFQFEFIDNMPLTINQKVDRKKLSTYTLIEKASDENIIEKLSEDEELLLNLVKSVLNINDISINDNFFSLGGHSLLAIKLDSRIKEAFEIELPLNIIFEKETLREIATEIRKITNDGQFLEIVKINEDTNDQDLKLSFSQQRMWFMQKFDPNNYSNNITSSFNISGKLNFIAFENSINKIIGRHEILRTYYSEKIGKPVQVVENKYHCKINFIDYTNLNSALFDSEIKKIIINEDKRVYDLTKLPLFNITVIKKDDLNYILILTMHHIVSDGWSISLLIKELVEFYSNETNGKELSLPELKIQYSDFAQWQRKWLSGKNLEKQFEYWKSELNDIPEKIDLPIDKIRPPIQTFFGDHLDFSFSEERTSEFIKFVNSNNFTPYMVSLAVFNILLHKYSNQNTIVVGTPIANRNHKEIENLIGFFVNTLAIKTEFNANDKIIDVLRRVRKKTLSSYINQDLPFEYLVDKLNTKREMSHSPIFQVAFIFQNSQSVNIVIDGLEFKLMDSENKISKYDLSLYMQIRSNKLFGTFEYNTSLFNVQTIERMSEHFSHLLNTTVKNPQMQISKLSVVNELESKRIYNEISLGKRTSVLHNNIVEKFRIIANKYGKETAVTFSEFDGNNLFTEQITYNELNLRSNQLAHYLIKNGLKNEELVGVSLKRSIDLIVSILGILKAGGAFIPIDPFYPSDRIEYMINDSGMKFLITHDIIQPESVNKDVKVILLEKEADKISEENENNISISIDKENLAYVIYTSGSTGKPKGTLLIHKGVLNLAQIQKEEFSISADSRILQFSSLSFDAFVWEIFMALLNGASINLVTQEIISSIEQLIKVLNVLKISVVTLPPSVLNIIPHKYSDELVDLKTIIVAGEKCSSELANKWNRNRKFFNAYGPTETTVCASMFLYDENSEQNPPIGKPNENFSSYVLDKNMNLLPVGIPGELYISGTGLARGYLNLTNMTAAKFLPDPFSFEQGARMYKTGDLVKYLSSGNIEFIGRIDNQVKLRGFRIELGEIESVIRTYSDINDVLVLIKETASKQKQIASYIIWAQNSERDIDKLKIYIKKILPEYMVPSYFIELEKFPLTPSNKIDINALPDLSGHFHDIKYEYTAPRNENEIVMEKIGMELLNIERMGIYDNFFELGGHSLLATQFISRLNLELNTDITLKMLFENPTIAKLSEKLNQTPISGLSNKIDIVKQERSSGNLFSLLEELNKISDEDAKSLIDKERTS